MDLIQTVLDNYIVYVFGSYWFAALFFIGVSIYVMSQYNVSYTNQMYVVLFSSILFIDLYLGISLNVIILIAISFMVGLTLAKKFFNK